MGKKGIETVIEVIVLKNKSSSQTFLKLEHDIPIVSKFKIVKCFLQVTNFMSFRYVVEVLLT
jgi:hypothetical protein